MRSIFFVLASALLASLAFAGTTANAGGMVGKVCRLVQVEKCTLPPAPKPKPRRHYRPRVVAHRPSACVAYRVSGEPSTEVAAFIAAGNPRVAKPLALTVSFYEHSEFDLYRLEHDPCTYAVDAGTHERLGLEHDCKPCQKPGEQQEVWPDGVALGTKTTLVFYVVSIDGKRVGFPSGSGTVYLPRWFDASSVWCFDAAGKYLGLNAARSWQMEYDAYYDEISLAEDRAALAAKSSTFSRVLRPAHPIGQ